MSHGGSLEMWRDYFGPACRVTGVDIDPRCAALGGDRITVVTGDQEDRAFLHDLPAAAGPPDIVIDDGGHGMRQQINTLEEIWPYLAYGGTWLTEDTHTSYWDRFGGGLCRQGTFVEYAKRIADQVSAWHSETPGFQPDMWTRTVAGIHFYDSVVVLDKDQIREPSAPEVTGRTSF